MPSITLHWVQVPLLEPFRISNGAIAIKDAILVEYEKDGVSGWGEASPMAGSFYSAETPESSWAALERMCPAVLSDESVELDNIVPGEPFAKAGLRGALTSHQTTLLDVPLWQHLGGTLRRIESGVAIGLYDTIDELLERVERYIRQGYRRVKIKVQPGWDIEPVRHIRERWPDLPLMVDANCAYRTADLPVFRELDRFGLMMYEQPLARHDWHGMAEFNRALATPVCADESAESPRALEEIIALKAASIVNIKIQRVGGIGIARQMHDRAYAAGLACWMGTMPELGVGSAEAVHLATLPGFVYPTDVEASARWYVDDVVDPLIAIDSEGYLTPRRYRVDIGRLERYRVRKQLFD